MRKECEIFDDLKSLCSQPGYIHILSYICFCEYFLLLENEPTIDDLLVTYDDERLIRNEISTLIGLMLKEEIDYNFPKASEYEGLINKTYALLKEFHYSMLGEAIPKITEEMNFKDNPLTKGCALREAIFFSGEAGYINQYIDFTREKYKSDDSWLISNKGYSIEEATTITEMINLLRVSKLNQSIDEYPESKNNEFILLNAFSYNAAELAEKTNIELDHVKNFLESFSLETGIRNEAFNNITDFNIYNAYPIIKKDNTYIIFQPYSLNEAIYNTPFYWIIKDKKYKNVGMKNRGDFLEHFVFSKLIEIFGENRVFKNVNIINSKKDIVGEIDILVIYSNRAVIFQAKSKKLTLLSRQGNDKSIREDFKKSIQDAYDQGYDCASYLNVESLKFKSEEVLCFPQKFDEIYLIPIISEHYPALSFQVREFLNVTDSDIIRKPYVLDIFAFDIICEFLSSPLLFLNYLYRRTEVDKRIITSQELTVLSYFLKDNLWIEKDYQMLYLTDDIGVELDRAYLVRKGEYTGNPNIDGYYTSVEECTIGKILKEIELREAESSIDLAFQILQLNQESILKLSDMLDTIFQKARDDLY